MNGMTVTKCIFMPAFLLKATAGFCVTRAQIIIHHGCIVSAITPAIAGVVSVSIGVNNRYSRFKDDKSRESRSLRYYFFGRHKGSPESPV